MPIFPFQLFNGHPELVAALSDKSAGSLRLGQDPAISPRRTAFLKELGIPDQKTVAAGLIHSMHSTPVGASDAGTIVPETDGLLTREKGLFLSVTVADCLPIYLYEPARKIVGILHAGWHGATIGMLPEALRQLTRMDGDPASLLAGIGPAIGACHFEIHPTLRDRFAEHTDAVIERDGKLFVDLKKIARDQLVAGGVMPENIEVWPECTYCLQDKYFSNRRDKPREIEAMMAVIGLRPEGETV